MIVLHDNTSHRLLCCAPIGLEGSKVFLQPIRDCEVQAHSDPGRWKFMSASIYFRAPPQENFAYCAPVGDVILWEYHQYLVGYFASSSILDWTLALDAWENTGKVD